MRGIYPHVIVDADRRKLSEIPPPNFPRIAILNGPLSGGSWLFVCPNHAPVRHNSGQATISRVRNIFGTLLPELVYQYRVREGALVHSRGKGGIRSLSQIEEN